MNQGTLNHPVATNNTVHESIHKNSDYSTNEGPDPSLLPSILDWITRIPTPAQTASLQPPQITPTHKPKRLRRSESLPSQFLEEQTAPRKKQKRNPLQEMAENALCKSLPTTPQSKSTTTSSHSLPENTSTSISDYLQYPENRNISPSKSAAALLPRKNAYNVGRAMDAHGMVHDDTRAYLKYPSFVDKINAIVDSKRSSHVKLQSARKFEGYLKKYERSNESTFLRVMFPLLMKDGYHVCKDRADFSTEEKRILEEDGQIYRDLYLEEGITVALDQEFLRSLIPSIHSDPGFEKSMAEELAKIAGMKNPKPDYVFGSDSDNVPRLRDAPMPENTRALLGICPGMENPFLIVEGKPDSGSAAEAQNQARRGGATLVNAARMLRATVEELPDIEGPDERSFVFSFTMSPMGAEFWVHWYQGPAEKQVFHMNRIASHSLYGYDNIDGIRQKLHNVIEWGAITRLNELQGLYGSIHTYARKVHAKNVAIQTKKGRKRKGDEMHGGP